MPAGGLMHEDVLVVSEGFDALARPLVGVTKYEQRFEVWDRAGRVIGHVEPAFRDSGPSKLFRWLFALVFSSSTSRDVLDYRVVEPLGSTVLELEIRGRVLYLKDPIHGPAGWVANTSKPGSLEATFHVAAPARHLPQKDPPPIASMNHESDRPPFVYELKDARGTVFARVVNEANRRNRLEVLDGSDPRLRTLAVGFVCGMVDRVWLRARKTPSSP